MRWNATVMTLVLMTLPLPAAAQGFADSAKVDTIVVRPRPSCLALPPHYYHTRIDHSLSMTDAPRTPNLSGYEVYRLSKMRCTLKGAGMGATAGFMAGAFGEMMGAWDEKSSWYMAGAMAAFGAFYGGKIKADDEGWNLQIRLEPEHGN